MKKIILFTILILIFLTVTLLGQPKDSESHVKVEATSTTDSVEAGSTTTAVVIIDIDEGWHINSNMPTFDYLIGTQIELTPITGISVAGITYPDGNNIKFAFAEQPLNVYEGKTIVYLTLNVAENVTLGKNELSGKVQVQACNDQVCLPPSEIEFKLPLFIVPKGTLVAEASAETLRLDQPAPYSPATPLSPSQAIDYSDIFNKGGIYAFLAIFLIGLALNLTPCVYPMLSVTVSLFGAQTDTKTIKVFLKALVYVLGMATMYSVLGVSAAMTGGLFGNWLQSPWVLGGIGILLFALALSMFGAYQIIAPYWLTSKLGDSGTGYIGLFLSGLVVGIFAAPCVGPPIIALLALVGSKGDALFGFQIFFTLAMGLGLPYLILGTFSNLLKKIPRSGVWMVWVERLFGVVLTAVAFFYFSMALVPKLSAYIIPVAFTVGGVYLGFLEPSGKEKKGLTWFKRTFGTIAVIAGIFIFLTFQKPGIEWEKYSPEKLEHAKAKGNTVILDFYADWCIPCLELDKKTFTDEQVIDATKYFVRLKVDLTKYDSPESEALRKQFNIAGVPTIIFINSRGEEVTAARIVGFLEAQEFIQKVMMVD